MRYEETDTRALAAGALVAAVVVFAATAWAGSTRALAVSTVLAAVPAGFAVGMTTRGYGTELLEGGLAAVGGSVLAVVAYGLVQTALATGVPLAYRFDELFLVSLYGFWTLVVVGPFAFLAGGLLARWTRSRSWLGGLVRGAGT